MRTGIQRQQIAGIIIELFSIYFRFYPYKFDSFIELKLMNVSIAWGCKAIKINLIQNLSFEKLLYERKGVISLILSHVSAYTSKRQQNKFNVQLARERYKSK